MKKGFTLAESTTHVNMPSFKTKSGFTLAEVLITLGIIGIVSAMTLPALNANIRKKQTVAKLQKAISIINQAYKLSESENGEGSSEELFNMGAEAYFEKYWQPYIKTLVFCHDYKECGYKSNKPFYLFNGNSQGSELIKNKSRIAFITMEGFVFNIRVSEWNFDTHNFGNQASTIIIDINGSKLPNTVGKDVFFLSRTSGEGILPRCSKSSQAAINSDCSITGSGNCCVEKIKRAGWKIDSTYPW